GRDPARADARGRALGSAGVVLLPARARCRRAVGCLAADLHAAAHLTTVQRQVIVAERLDQTCLDHAECSVPVPREPAADGATRSFSNAKAAAAVRLPTSSFAKMFETCLATVRSDRTSSAAIWALLAPAAT